MEHESNFDKWLFRCLAIAIILTLVCFGVSTLMRPKEFRSSIYPKVIAAVSRADKLENRIEVNKEAILSLKEEIEMVKDHRHERNLKNAPLFLRKVNKKKHTLETPQQHLSSK